MSVVSMEWRVLANGMFMKWRVAANRGFHEVACCCEQTFPDCANQGLAC